MFQRNPLLIIILTIFCKLWQAFIKLYKHNPEAGSHVLVAIMASTNAKNFNDFKIKKNCVDLCRKSAHLKGSLPQASHSISSKSEHSSMNVSTFLPEVNSEKQTLNTFKSIAIPPYWYFQLCINYNNFICLNFL